MLAIRQKQMQILDRRLREQFIDEMVKHLYSFFPKVAWLLKPDELRQQLNRTIARAAFYELTTQRQACRYINLAATYGWEFDRAPDLLWMRKILTDTSPSQPSERLDRLIQTCLHRQAIEEHNQALRRQLGFVRGAASTEVDRQSERDDANNSDANIRIAEASEDNILAGNPRPYQISKSLWHSPNAMPTAPPTLAVLAWTRSESALLRNKTGKRDVLGN